MIQGMRVGSPIYLFDKNELKVDIGEIVFVGNPVPQYQATYQAGNFLQPKNTVDVKVKVGENTIELQKLPAEQSAADFGSMVVCESLDVALAEVDAVKKLSSRALGDVPKHEHIVERCDAILSELNPQIKKDIERSNEIAKLQQEMSDMKEMLTQFMSVKKKKED